MARKDVFLDEETLSNMDFNNENESRELLENVRDELKLLLQIQRYDGLTVCYEGKQLLSACIQTLSRRYNPKGYQATLEKATQYLRRKHVDAS